jgi:SUMO ligase MMS21 Smc5/6 complex component
VAVDAMVNFRCYLTISPILHATLSRIVNAFTRPIFPTDPIDVLEAEAERDHRSLFCNSQRLSAEKKARKISNETAPDEAKKTLTNSLWWMSSLTT